MHRGCGVNKKVAIIAAALATKMVDDGFVPVDNRMAALQSLGQALQPLLYPERCNDCGARLCPGCGEHMEPPLPDGKLEVEQWDFCFPCLLYVKPDGTQVTAKQAGQDVRRIDIAVIDRKVWEN
jgi:hypothetical protein